MQKEIRQPVQQRSIETKRKIIKAGYTLFSKNGFFKTNTAQIAKEAQVSTGIVYGYFQDKKDILKEVINEYITQVYDPVFALLDNIGKKEDVEKLIKDVLVLAEELHKNSSDIHRELESVAQSDEEINKTFVGLQDQVTLRFVEKLKALNYKNITNENIHLAMNLIESYVHEVVYDKHLYINYDKLKQNVIFLIKSLFI
ncbi:MAG: TetR/AcrR family transcriptional regulator [Clostridia bacterium]|nr:TetR/AcrR family transcriptional regulator [Clostridia bacterium]